MNDHLNIPYIPSPQTCFSKTQFFLLASLILLKFDNKIFDEYHHIIEDYCCQISFQLSLKIYTLLINTYIPDNDKFDKSVLKNKYFVHYNNTFSQKGARWGSWEVYKRKLDQKWKRKVITT